MNTKRISWIDTARAIAIFLVLFGHYIDTEFVRVYVYSFHMPLFFFVSGLVYIKKDPFGLLLKKRFRTLIVPYFIFSIAYIVFFILRQKYGDTPDKSASLGQKIIRMITLNELWFLGSLFVVSISFFWIADYVKKARPFCCFAVTATLLHYLSATYGAPYIHESLLKCCTGIVFYGAGFVLGDWLRNDDVVDRFIRHRLCVPIVGIVLGINIALFAVAYQNYSMLSAHFLGKYVVLYGCAFTGIALSCIGAMLIRPNQITGFIGANTLLVYVLEGYPGSLIRRFMEKVFSVENFENITTAYAALYSLMALVILAPVIVLINRYAPWVAGKSRVAGRDSP